jgi:hypothetical protein
VTRPGLDDYQEIDTLRISDYECDSLCAMYVAIALSHAMFHLQNHDDIITTSSALGALYRMSSVEQENA